MDAHKVKYEKQQQKAERMRNTGAKSSNEKAAEAARKDAIAEARKIKQIAKTIIHCLKGKHKDPLVNLDTIGNPG